MKIDPINILLNKAFTPDKKFYFISGNEKTLMEKIKSKPQPINLPNSSTSAPLLTPDINGTLPTPDMMKIFNTNPII